jgi:hypothetical protein
MVVLFIAEIVFEDGDILFEGFDFKFEEFDLVSGVVGVSVQFLCQFFK